MALTKRSVTETVSNDIYYVAYEDKDFVYFVSDDVAFEIEQKAKDSDSQESSLRNSADVVINKTTKQVVKSRWF